MDKPVEIRVGEQTKRISEILSPQGIAAMRGDAGPAMSDGTAGQNGESQPKNDQSSNLGHTLESWFGS